MIWLAVLAMIAIAFVAAWLAGRLDRRAGVAQSSCTDEKPSTAIGMWLANGFVLLVPLLLVLALRPAKGADLDPYACFGAARYVAMAESFSCADLPSFCAGAQALLNEAGSRPAAEKLARARGHSRMAIMLAKRYCR